LKGLKQDTIYYARDQSDQSRDLSIEALIERIETILMLVSGLKARDLCIYLLKP